MVLKYWRETLIFTLFLLLVLTTLKCKGERERLNANAEVLADSISNYRNRLGTITASKKNLLVSNRELANLIFRKNDTLRKLAKDFRALRSLTSFKNTITLPTVKIKLEQEKIGNRHDTLVKNSGMLKNSWYAFNYTINDDTLTIKNFTIPNKTVVMSGSKRKWFLGEAIVTTDVTHSNPYISTEDLMSVEIKVPDPWYKKWYLWLAAGITAGLFIK